MFIFSSSSSDEETHTTRFGAESLMDFNTGYADAATAVEDISDRDDFHWSCNPRGEWYKWMEESEDETQPTEFEGVSHPGRWLSGPKGRDKLEKFFTQSAASRTQDGYRLILWWMAANDLQDPDLREASQIFSILGVPRPVANKGIFDRLLAQLEFELKDVRISSLQFPFRTSLHHDVFIRYRRLCFRALRRLSVCELHPAIEAILARAPPSLNQHTNAVTGAVEASAGVAQWPVDGDSTVPSPFLILTHKPGNERFIETVSAARVLQGVFLFKSHVALARVDLLIDDCCLQEKPNLKILVEVIGRYPLLYWRCVDLLIVKTRRLIALRGTVNVLDKWTYDENLPAVSVLPHSRYSDLRVALYLAVRHSGMDIDLCDPVMNCLTAEGPKGLAKLAPTSPRTFLDCLVILNSRRAREAITSWLAKSALEATDAFGSLRAINAPLDMLAVCALLVPVVAALPASIDQNVDSLRWHNFEGFLPQLQAIRNLEELGCTILAPGRRQTIVTYLTSALTISEGDDGRHLHENLKKIRLTDSHLTTLVHLSIIALFQEMSGTRPTVSKTQYTTSRSYFQRELCSPGFPATGVYIDALRNVVQRNHSVKQFIARHLLTKDEHPCVLMEASAAGLDVSRQVQILKSFSPAARRMPPLHVAAVTRWQQWL